MSATLATSSMFAAASAEGSDWRDVGRKILEKLESVRTEGDGMSVGFVYATQALAPEIGSLLSLLKNITRIQHWYGATGTGICAGGRSHSDGCAAAVMIGALPAGSFQGFRFSERGGLPSNLRLWLSGRNAVAAVTHGILCLPAVNRLAQARDRDGLFMAGGFSSGQAGGVHIADGGVLQDPPLSGVALDHSVRIATAVSNGCLQAGRAGRITKTDGNRILTIDDRPAFDFLNDAVAGIDIDRPEDVARTGHVHAAFPVAGSDTGTVLVRNITDVDEKAKTLSVAHSFTRGDAIQFVYRDSETTRNDLVRTLEDLRKRAGGAPKGILYFGCGARTPLSDEDDEAALIRIAFGDVPTVGFYTAAEICNGHVFGYTGVVVLFL